MIRNASNDQLSRIDDILRQLDQSTEDKTQENRRRAPRIIIHTTLTALVLSHGGNLSLRIFTRNISTSGIGFVCRRFCREGERLAICFSLPDRPSKMVLAQVTFSRYVRAGLYEAGAEFIECITGADENDLPSSWSQRSDSLQTDGGPSKKEIAAAAKAAKAGKKGKKAEDADSADSAEEPAKNAKAGKQKASKESKESEPAPVAPTD